jgi:outer membrane assembly lipoprotein YfiO
MGFFERKEYARAVSEFGKLLKNYAQAPQAPDAQYFIGRAYEAQTLPYEAFEAYHKVLQIYPATTRTEEIAKRCYDIAMQFQSGEKRAILGAKILSGRTAAIEIFKAVATDAPFSKHGELAQFKLGQAYEADGQFEEAVSAYEELIRRYPSSTMIEDARFRIAQASQKGTFRPSYDQSPTDKAIKELQAFKTSHGGSDLAVKAEEQISVLEEKRAQHALEIAVFYERQKAWRSALIYYRDIATHFPKSSMAVQAAAKVAELERLVETDTP